MDHLAHGWCSPAAEQQRGLLTRESVADGVFYLVATESSIFLPLLPYFCEWDSGGEVIYLGNI